MDEGVLKRFLWLQLDKCITFGRDSWAGLPHKSQRESIRKGHKMNVNRRANTKYSWTALQTGRT